MSHIFLSASPALLDIKGCFQFLANINSTVVDILGAPKLCTFLVISLGTIASHKAAVSKGVHFSKALVSVCGISILPSVSSSNTDFQPTKDRRASCGCALRIWR